MLPITPPGIGLIPARTPGPDVSVTRLRRQSKATTFFSVRQYDVSALGSVSPPQESIDQWQGYPKGGAAFGLTVHEKGAVVGFYHTLDDRHAQTGPALG